ncbi:hypothetical protein [Thermomonas brevis]
MTDMHGQNGRRLLAQKKNSKKKIPKKKATNKHNLMAGAVENGQ